MTVCTGRIAGYVTHVTVSVGADHNESAVPAEHKLQLRLQLMRSALS